MIQIQSEKIQYILPAIFALVCFLFAIIFPFFDVIETVVGIIVFMWILPLFFIRYALKDTTPNPLAFFGKTWSKNIAIVSGLTLASGVGLAYLFTHVSVIDIYTADLAAVSMTHPLLVLGINVIYFLPFIFVPAIFAFGFVPYTLHLSRPFAYILGISAYLIVFYIIFDNAFPNVPFWFYIPLFVPLSTIGYYRRVGMTYIVPILILLINIFYQIFLISL